MLDLDDLYLRAREDRLLELLMHDEITGTQAWIVKRVLQVPETNCWEWQGVMHHSGYGCFKQAGKFVYSHIASYRAFNGPTDGKFVCHACDNPKCCHPRHLFLGTHQENMDDMKAKGRGRNQSSKPREIA